MSGKTLCIFSPAFPNDANQGWLPPVQVFIHALNRNFPELKVVIFSFQYPYNTKAYNWYGNNIIPFNGMHKKRPQRLLMWMNILTAFYKLKKENDVVGILSLWCGECAFVAKYCANFFSVKHYCWILGQDARPFNTYVKRIRPKAESLVALSDFVQDEFFRSHGIKPAHVITKGIDTRMFNELPNTKDIDIIGVGSLSFMKQYSIFVEVIAELKKSMPGIKAMLCGDGEDMENIKLLIDKLGLKNNIALTGTLEHRDGLKAMQRSKILLHPSSYEGFGLVCIEALYAGAHVISFCRPMYQPLKNWHIVETKEQMLEKALAILNSNTVYEQVLTYSIDESAAKIMALFD